MMKYSDMKLVARPAGWGSIESWMEIPEGCYFELPMEWPTGTILRFMRTHDLKLDFAFKKKGDKRYVARITGLDIIDQNGDFYKFDHPLWWTATEEQQHREPRTIDTGAVELGMGEIIDHGDTLVLGSRQFLVEVIDKKTRITRLV